MGAKSGPYPMILVPKRSDIGGTLVFGVPRLFIPIMVLFISSVVFTSGGWTFLLISCGALFISYYLWRGFHVSVEIGPDSIVVQNLLMTHHISLSQQLLMGARRSWEGKETAFLTLRGKGRPVVLHATYAKSLPDRRYMKQVIEEIAVSDGGRSLKRYLYE